MRQSNPRGVGVGSGDGVPDNPCDRIDPVLGPQRDVVQHMVLST